MRRLVVAIVAAVLLIGVLPATIRAQPAHPHGIPQLYYLVELPGFPTIRATCEPADCAANPTFLLGTIRPENCPIPAFATRDEAQTAVQQQLPFPPVPWFIVQAIDTAHAFATVIVETSNPPGTVPASLTAVAEDYVAAEYNRVCSAS